MSITINYIEYPSQENKPLQNPNNNKVNEITQKTVKKQTNEPAQEESHSSPDFGNIAGSILNDLNPLNIAKDAGSIIVNGAKDVFNAIKSIF